MADDTQAPHLTPELLEVMLELIKAFARQGGFVEIALEYEQGAS